MSTSNSTFTDSSGPQKGFPWGCLVGGCLSVFLLIVIGLSATFYATYQLVKAQVDAYTSTQPVEIRTVEYTEQEVAAVKQRIEDFKVALEKGESPEQLVLTADDINAMISSEKELKGKLFVKIEDGEIKGEASFPLPEGLLLGKGRYFNGSISMKASLDNGVLIVQVDEAEVNGKPVPEDFMKSMRNQNLAKDAYKDPETAKFLKKFKSLTIEDNKVILTPAEKKPDDVPAEAAQSKEALPTEAGSNEAQPTENGSAKAEITEKLDLVPSNPN